MQCNTILMQIHTCLSPSIPPSHHPNASHHPTKPPSIPCIPSILHAIHPIIPNASHAMRSCLCMLLHACACCFMPRTITGSRAHAVCMPCISHAMHITCHAHHMPCISHAGHVTIAGMPSCCIMSRTIMLHHVTHHDTCLTYAHHAACPSTHAIAALLDTTCASKRWSHAHPFIIAWPPMHHHPHVRLPL